MPTDIFEDGLELEIGLLEAGKPTKESYPYPTLTPTDTTEKRTFRTVILENPYLRASFVPALGGRLISIFDKRTQTEVFDQGPLIPLRGGARGAYVNRGLQIHLNGQERLTSLAAAQYAAQEATEEHEPALWLAEAVTGTGLSWHLRVTMPPDRAELLMEARVFNRTYEPVPYSGGLLLPRGDHSLASGDAFICESQGRGVLLSTSRGTWSVFTGECFVLSRFPEQRLLVGRQLDSWKIRVTPYSGLDQISAASTEVALCAGQKSISLQAATPLKDHKLVLLSEQGESLEAPLTIAPERKVQYDLPGPIKAAAILDPAKNVVLTWDSHWKVVEDAPPTTTSPRNNELEIAGWSDRELEDAIFSMNTRHLAHAILAERALASQKYEEAEFQFEQTLLYNGEDHLVWWLKGHARRLAGDVAEENPELPNAHYLAPLEPILRAEGFLSQASPMGKEPYSLLKPLSEFPESFVEVACLLLDAKLFEEAARWLDEAIRHVDLRMLRYLLAYAHVSRTGMDFEAAQQVSAAAKVTLEPPYPWRPIEKLAIQELVARFPNDPGLAEFHRLIGLRLS